MVIKQHYWNSQDNDKITAIRNKKNNKFMTASSTEGESLWTLVG